MYNIEVWREIRMNSIDEEYLKNLDTYYTLKNEYDTKKKRLLKHKDIISVSSKKQKRLKYNELLNKLPCVSCGRKVGSIFEERDGFFIAICGDTSSPCKLNIRLKKSNTLQVKQNLEENKSILNATEYDMIKLKLDHLFGFIDETTLVELYETYKAEYDETNDIYTLLETYFQQILDTQQKNAKIRSAKQSMFENIKDLKMYVREYLATNNTSLISDAIDTYMDTILPAQQEIRDTTYDAFYLDNEPVKIGKSSILKYTLVKKPYTIETDSYILEQPETIEFTV